MSRLTQSQRHEIYVLALKMLQQEIADGDNTVICPNLELLCYTTHGFDAEIRKDFPEFYAQKPTDKAWDDCWWSFSTQGNNKRIKALEKAIDLTREQNTQIHEQTTT